MSLCHAKRLTPKGWGGLHGRGSEEGIEADSEDCPGQSEMRRAPEENSLRSVIERRVSGIPSAPAKKFRYIKRNFLLRAAGIERFTRCVRSVIICVLLFIE